MACPDFRNRIVGYEDLKMSNGGTDITAEMVCKTPQEMLETCQTLGGTKVDQVAIEPLKVLPDPRNLDYQNARKIIDEQTTLLLQQLQEFEAAQQSYFHMLYRRFPA